MDGKNQQTIYIFQDHFGFLINGLTIYDQGKGKIWRFFLHLYSL